MSLSTQSFESNVKILKSQVSKYAFYGLFIAVAAIVVATFGISWQKTGTLDLTVMIFAHKSNIALWILDATPFLFAFWGQYVGSMMSYAASALVIDQTNELRLQASTLETKVLHESLHDSLTNLPNRMLFVDRLTQALTIARSEHKKLAILTLDINDFKDVNDALGHYNGDRLLKQISVRLQNVIQRPYTFSSFGGDEFAILIPELKFDSDANDCAKKLQKALETPFSLDGITITVRAAIGIVLYPKDGSDHDTLLQRADMAMSVSKLQKMPYILYTDDLDTTGPHKLILMADLHQAIENDSLTLHFQPKIDLKQRKVTGVETLVRWNHPKYGLIPSDRFVPVAERTGLIQHLTHWVLNQALKQLSQWHKEGVHIGISINLSTLDITDVELPETIAGLIAAYDIDPHWITLELTESAFMHDQERSLETLNQLAQFGLKLSIDDFGTGYSSLSYLSQLPVNEIKIDKSFVMGMKHNKQDNVIVQMTIDLAKNLELIVVAEGIEDAETYDALTRLNCHMGQGYHMSKPIPADDFLTWLQTTNETSESDFCLQGVFAPPQLGANKQ